MLKVGVPRFTRVPQLLVYNHKNVKNPELQSSSGFFIIALLYHHLFSTFSAKPGKSRTSITVPSSSTALPVKRPNT